MLKGKGPSVLQNARTNIPAFFLPGTHWAIRLQSLFSYIFVCRFHQLYVRLRSGIYYERTTTLNNS